MSFHRRAAMSITLLISLLLFFGAEAASCPFAGYKAEKHSQRALAEGVVYETYSLVPKNGPAGQSQRLYLIDIDPKANPKLKITSAFQNGRISGAREKVSALCAEEKMRTRGTVLCAVNGDFFDMAAGGSLGDMMREGRWITAGEFQDGWAFAYTKDGRAIIAQPRVTLTLRYMGADGAAQTVKINALNAPRADLPLGSSSPANALNARQDNLLVLYTEDYAEHTGAAAGGIEVRFKTDDEVRTGEALHGTISEVLSGGESPAALGGGYMALSGVGSGADALRALKKGGALEIICEASPLLADAVTVTGGGRPDGGPLLVSDGQEADPTDALADDYGYFYGRNPRTIAGIRADGTFFFLLIEGNRSGSYGMTIKQAKRTALELGAQIAVNLDGGPSSTMVLSKGSGFRAVSNTTGSGSETRVGNALILLETND